jgi:hypothetical protein
MAAEHALEQAVASGLHGHVNVAAEHVEVAVGFDQGAVEEARVGARVTKASESRHILGDATEQGCEVGLGVGGSRPELACGVLVVVDCLAQQDDLESSSGHDIVDLIDDLLGGAMALGTAGRGHDAERASLVTALGDGDERGRADVGAGSA